MQMRGRRPKASWQKKRSISFTGYQWQEILLALDIYELDLNDENPDLTYTIEEIRKRILKYCVLPPARRSR